MITADKLKHLTTLPHQMLQTALGRQAKEVALARARFVGITTGHEFCYSVTNTDGVLGKVFVTYDSVEDQITVSY